MAFGEQLDNDMGEDVGGHHLEPAPERRGQRPLGQADPAPFYPVAPQVFGGNAHGHLVAVSAAQPPGPELGRGQQENARAGADVQKRVAGFQMALDQLHAEGGRRVRAGAERHARIEFQHDLPRAARIIPPGRLDHDALADFLRPEKGLPGLGPVLLIDSPVTQAVNQTDMVAQPGDFRLQHRAARVEALVFGQVADHGMARRPRHGVLGPLLLGFELRILHHHSLEFEFEEGARDQIAGQRRIGMVEGHSGFDVVHFPNFSFGGLK